MPAEEAIDQGVAAVGARDEQHCYPAAEGEGDAQDQKVRVAVSPELQGAVCSCGEDWVAGKEWPSAAQAE